MAGTNQHTIPQSLLRRFGKKPRKGKHTRVAVYEQGNVFVAATTGAAAQRYFYSRPSEDGSRTLDDAITRYEPRIVEILKIIDALESGAIVPPQYPAELISHLFMRTSQARESFTHAVGKVLGAARGLMNDPATRWRMMGFDKPYPNGPALEEANKYYDSYGLSRLGVDRARFVQWMFDSMKAKYHPARGPTPLGVEPFLQALEQGLPAVAANAQKRALERNLGAEGREAVLRGLTWMVRDTSFDLILPDCIAIGGLGREDCRALAYRPNEQLQCVVMPVSARRFIAGAPSPAALPAPEGLNAMLAKCSWRFFVARERSPALETLRPHIGTATRPFLDAITAETAASHLPV